MANGEFSKLFLTQASKKPHLTWMGDEMFRPLCQSLRNDPGQRLQHSKISVHCESFSSGLDLIGGLAVLQATAAA